MKLGHIKELMPLSPLKVLTSNIPLFLLVIAPCIIASTELNLALYKSLTVPFFISSVTDNVTPRFVETPDVYNEIAVLVMIKK